MDVADYTATPDQAPDGTWSSGDDRLPTAFDHRSSLSWVLSTPGFSRSDPFHDPKKPVGILLSLLGCWSWKELLQEGLSDKRFRLRGEHHSKFPSE